MSPVRIRLAAVLSIAGFAATGCGSGSGSGSGSSDLAKIKRTIQSAFTALSGNNGPAFCALATTAGQATLAQALPGSTCAKVVTLVGEHLSAAQRQGLRHAQIANATITGHTASVKSSDISTTQGTLKGFLNGAGKPTMLSKQSDGSWKISG